MSERLTEITGPGGERAHVALITFSDAEAAAAYEQRRKLRFPILVDSTREVYDAYGLATGSFLDVWGWSAIKRYWQILRPSGPGRVADLQRATQDTRQLGGDMVIAADGRLVWGHWSARSTDRPTVEEIARAAGDAVTVTRPAGRDDD